MWNAALKLDMIRHPIYSWEHELGEWVASTCGKEPSGHDFWHTLRVRNLCIEIANSERLRAEPLVGASYVHDVGRPEEQNSRSLNSHVEIALNIAHSILPKVCFPMEFFEIACACIREHENYISLHEKNCDHVNYVHAFQDADRLDAIGAIGIARCFTFGGSHGKPLWNPLEDSENWQPGLISKSSIHHFEEKLKLLGSSMNTNLGRLLAAKRDKIITRFLEEFHQEWRIDGVIDGKIAEPSGGRNTE